MFFSFVYEALLQKLVQSTAGATARARAELFFYVGVVLFISILIFYKKTLLQVGTDGAALFWREQLAMLQTMAIKGGETISFRNIMVPSSCVVEKMHAESHRATILELPMFEQQSTSLATIPDETGVQPLLSHHKNALQPT